MESQNTESSDLGNTVGMVRHLRKVVTFYSLMNTGALTDVICFDHDNIDEYVKFAST